MEYGAVRVIARYSVWTCGLHTVNRRATACATPFIAMDATFLESSETMEELGKSSGQHGASSGLVQ